jgi:hypothetical protein
MDEWFGGWSEPAAFGTTWEPAGPWKKTLIVHPRTTITGKKVGPFSVVLKRKFKSNRNEEETRYAESVFEVLQEKK